MKPVGLAVLALLLLACEDVEGRATPTRVPFAGVVVASSDGRLGEAEVPTAVAGASVRREQAGGPIVMAVLPKPTRTPRPTATPRPAAAAGLAERRGTPALDRRSAATATARAGLERVVRAGAEDEARRARSEGGALSGLGAAGGTGAGGLGGGGFGAAGGASAGGADGLGAGAAGGAIRQVGAGELARVFSGLPRDEARCSELALAERGTRARREGGLPVPGSAQTEILLEQLEAGCLPDGVALTPELAQALAARPPAGLVTTGGDDALGALRRPETGTLTDRDRATTADRLAREDAFAAPDPLPPRDPFVQDRPVTSRPRFRDTLRSAAGTGP